MEKQVKKMKDYSKGKIYKIWSKNTNNIYIGSTCKTKEERLGKHVNHFDAYCKGNRRILLTSCYILDNDHYDIEIIELFPCENKKQLIDREGYYIRLYSDICVNKVIPNRNKKQYHLDNKDKISAKNYEWYMNNKDKKKQYNEKYLIENKDKISQRTKEYRIINKDKIKEYKTEYYKNKLNCECGSNIRKDSLNKHLKTKIHINFITNLNENK